MNDHDPPASQESPALDAVLPPEMEPVEPQSTESESVEAQSTEPQSIEPSARPVPPRPPLRPEPRTLPIFLVVLLLFVIAGVLVYFFGPGSQVRPFNSHLAEYTNTQGLKVVNGPPPAVVGKAIVIDADKNEIDPVTFSLPEDIRPHRHDEIGSVILHKRLPAKEVGSYGGVGDQLALVQVWRLLFIDRGNHIMYAWTDVDGPYPRAKVQSKEGNQTGGVPTAALIDAVSQLKHVPLK